MLQECCQFVSGRSPGLKTEWPRSALGDQADFFRSRCRSDHPPPSPPFVAGWRQDLSDGIEEVWAYGEVRGPPFTQVSLPGWQHTLARICSLVSPCTSPPGAGRRYLLRGSETVKYRL